MDLMNLRGQVRGSEEQRPIKRVAVKAPHGQKGVLPGLIIGSPGPELESAQIASVYD